MSGAADGDDAYDLGASFPIAEARRQRPGTTLLITGTAALTERAALDILLAEPDAGEGVVPVSTDRSAADLESELAGRSGGSLDDRLAVIDITGGSERGTRPDDLATIGRELNEAIDRVDRRRVRIGVLSLTGMLEHLDRTEVFKFCHVVRDRIADAGYLGIATLDTDAVPEATVSMLQDAFDATVEVDEDEKGGIVRVIGLADAPVTWHAWS
jgi:KaiC/GvpD/RAD55 family RecA-like ATPase